MTLKVIVKLLDNSILSLMISLHLLDLNKTWMMDSISLSALSKIQSLAALSKKYGPLMFLKLGQTPTLVISSPIMAREVRKTHDLKFINRPQTTAGIFLLYGCQDMPFSPYGEYCGDEPKRCVFLSF
uniref:Uncharacterized protein n=1 Tax=Cucumis melo TaxID=3656 RepID=A0A9I9EMC7_CUCME